MSYLTHRNNRLFGSVSYIGGCVFMLFFSSLVSEEEGTHTCVSVWCRNADEIKFDSCFFSISLFSYKIESLLRLFTFLPFRFEIRLFLWLNYLRVYHVIWWYNVYPDKTSMDNRHTRCQIFFFLLWNDDNERNPQSSFKYILFFV